MEKERQELIEDKETLETERQLLLREVLNTQEQLDSNKSDINDTKRLLGENQQAMKNKKQAYEDLVKLVFSSMGMDVQGDEDRLNGMAEEVSFLETADTDFQTRLLTLMTKEAAGQTKMAGFTSRLATLHVTINAIDEKLQLLESNLSELSTAIFILRQKVADLEKQHL